MGHPAGIGYRPGTDSAMKILLMSSSSGSRGGGEIYLSQLAEGLMKSGMTVHVAMSSDEQMNELSSECRSRSIPVVRFNYLNTYHRRLRSVGAYFDRRQVQVAAELIGRLRPDLVHVNQQNVEDGLDLLLAARSSGIPALTTVHQPFGMARLKAIGGRLRDFVASRTFAQTAIDALAVSAMSAENLAGFLRRRVIPHSLSQTRCADLQAAVYCVSNGVGTPAMLDRRKTRTEWGIPEGAIVLGCVARIESEKNPLFVTRLLKDLPESVHCVWIGDGRMRVSLEEQVRALNLQHRFHIQGWKTNAAAHLNAMDIFLLPSLYEGLPLALLEAMSAGLPCVVSEVDGTRDAIDQGVSGFRCAVDDVRSWQGTLASLIDSPELRFRIGSAAKIRHAAEFSIEAMTQGTIAVYEDVVLKKRVTRNE